MWLFTKFGFYSVVKAKHTRKKGLFQIRARHDADLMNLKNEVSVLEKKKIHCYPDADYRYRIFVWSSELAEVFVALQDKLDYSNFKNEVVATPNQKEKYSYYTKVWGVMYGFQQQKENEKLGIDEQQYRPQLSLFRERQERDEGHEPNAVELNDYPELKEIPYTEEQERKLYSE